MLSFLVRAEVGPGQEVPQLLSLSESSFWAVPYSPAQVDHDLI